MQGIALLLTLAMTVAGLTEFARGAGPPETDIDIVAGYAIDADTSELVRYAFNTNTLWVAGEVRTAGGTTMLDMESLTYIGQGPAKGMYTVPTKNAPFANQLVKIDPFTTEATVFGPTLCSAIRKITGMTSVYDSGADEWYLLAASSEELASDPDRVETRELLRIDPLLGTSTIEASRAQLGDGRRFEGLGIDSDGNLWATARQWFYRIHQEAGALPASLRTSATSTVHSSWLATPGASRRSTPTPTGPSIRTTRTTTTTRSRTTPTALRRTIRSGRFPAKSPTCRYRTTGAYPEQRR